MANTWWMLTATERWQRTKKGGSSASGVGDAPCEGVDLARSRMRLGGVREIKAASGDADRACAFVAGGVRSRQARR